MYKIVCISSGIVVATFNDLSMAKDWLFENNTLSGEPANLFEIIKGKKWLIYTGPQQYQ